MKRLAWLRRNKQQLALTMIEMLMVLVVVAVIAVAAVRYYNIAQSTAQIKNLLDDVNTMIGATAEWAVANPKSSWGSLTEDTLVADGYLPGRFGNHQFQPNVFSARYSVNIDTVDKINVDVWPLAGSVCENVKAKFELKGYVVYCRTLGAPGSSITSTERALDVRVDLLDI